MLISVLTVIPSKSGLVWYPAEAIDASSLDDVFARLRDEGVLRIVKFESTRMPDGRYRIDGEVPKILGRAVVAEIQAFGHEIIPLPAAA